MSKPSPQQSRLNCEPLKKLIREVPDFPKKGILFYDITTLLKDKLGLAMLIDALAGGLSGAGCCTDPDSTGSVEARVVRVPRTVSRRCDISANNSGLGCVM